MMQTNREYKARLLLAEKALQELSRLALACDGDLLPPEWAALDEARLPDGRVSLGHLVSVISAARRRLVAGCGQR